MEGTLMKNISALLCAFIVSACVNPPLEASTISQKVAAPPNAVITWHSNAQTLVSSLRVGSISDPTGRRV